MNFKERKSSMCTCKTSEFEIQWIHYQFGDDILQSFCHYCAIPAFLRSTFTRPELPPYFPMSCDYIQQRTYYLKLNAQKNVRHPTAITVNRQGVSHLWEN